MADEIAGLNSTFSWLDHSDRDRRRALDVVDQLRESDTQDELGLGLIRDALADRLFPGTSTIQTRVRYFILLPWVFRSVEAQRGSTPWATRSREHQNRLRQSLQAGGETIGVIGFKAGRDVQRLPSSIYWHGLGRLGIRTFRGSETEYGRPLGARPTTRGLATNDDGEPLNVSFKGPWDPAVPPPQPGWLDSTTFELAPDERAYLTHRLRMAATHSLLTYLVERRVDGGTSAFVWNIVATAGLPPSLQNDLLHARNFSESMHGAALLYNLMLAEAKGDTSNRDRYRTAIAEWWQRRTVRAEELATWDRSEFWRFATSCGARVKSPTRAFVEGWLNATTAAPGPDAVIESKPLRSSIRIREQALKGSRARLVNRRALDMWRGASGIAQFDYRWKDPVRGMVRDLVGATQAPGHA